MDKNMNELFLSALWAMIISAGVRLAVSFVEGVTGIENTIVERYGIPGAALLVSFIVIRHLYSENKNRQKQYEELQNKRYDDLQAHYKELKDAIDTRNKK